MHTTTIRQLRLLSLAIALLTMLLISGCASPPAGNASNETAGSGMRAANQTTDAGSGIQTANQTPTKYQDNGISNTNNSPLPGATGVSGQPTPNIEMSNDTSLSLFDRFSYDWWGAPNFSGRMRARLGPANVQAGHAPAVMIEFMDYQCPSCGAVRNLTAQVLAAHPDLSLEWRYFPLPQMAYSRQAALGAECAADQGKYWEYSNAVMDDRQNLTFDKLYRLAGQAGVGNLTLWAVCTKSQWHHDVLSTDLNESKPWNVSATPTFVLNQKRYVYDGMPAHFMQFVDDAMAAR